MPELPEVERVCRSVRDHCLGRMIDRVMVRQPAVVTGMNGQGKLMCGGRVVKVLRHGKQIALVAEDCGNGVVGPAVSVHLGMTGSVRYLEAGCGWEMDKHMHVVWAFEDGSAMVFRDPRRFGRVRGYGCLEELKAERWVGLGEDALLIKPGELYGKLQKTRRAIKAALLDQRVVAGLGNIYVDELLFGCGIHPMTVANEIGKEQIRVMVRKMRVLLDKAIKYGGSSIRDYADARGKAGRFQFMHMVYGRAGMRCRKCDEELGKMVVGGRTTVWCGRCQPDGE